MLGNRFQTKQVVHFKVSSFYTVLYKDIPLKEYIIIRSWNSYCSSIPNTALSFSLQELIGIFSQLVFCLSLSHGNCPIGLTFYVLLVSNSISMYFQCLSPFYNSNLPFVVVSLRLLSPPPFLAYKLAASRLGKPPVLNVARYHLIIMIRQVIMVAIF